MREAHWPDYNEMPQQNDVGVKSAVDTRARAVRKVARRGPEFPPLPEPIGYAQMDDHGTITLRPRHGAAFKPPGMPRLGPDGRRFGPIEPFYTPDPGERIYVDRAMPPPLGGPGETPGIDQPTEVIRPICIAAFRAFSLSD